MAFCGSPLIVHTINQAKQCAAINKIVVSTDDKEIAAIAEKEGVEVIMRPDELSGDYATTASAVKHGLITLQQNNYSADAIVTLQVTSPIRPIHVINEAIELYIQSSGCDSVVAVSPNKHKLGIIKDGYYIATDYKTGSRSQDLKTQYYENGLVYVTNPKLVLDNEDLFGTKIVPYVVTELYAEIDIDDPDDFELAEILYKHYKNLF